PAPGSRPSAARRTCATWKAAPGACAWRSPSARGRASTIRCRPCAPPCGWRRGWRTSSSTRRPSTSRERPVRWRPPRRVDAAQPATPPAKSTKRGGSVGSTRQCPRSVTLPLHEVSAQWELARDSFTERLVVGAHFASEEHTSELQSRENLVCRLLLEKKKSELTRLA